MTKITILNTRPETSSQFTAKVFEDRGFAVINLPCITISSIDNDNEVAHKLNQINTGDVVIFTSQHAVKFAYQIYPALTINKDSTAICVGTKTSELLEQLTNADIWVPTQQNSHGVIELLKNLKQLNNIKLITAANGREKIQNYASSKSISLEQINVYQRRCPTINHKLLKPIEQTKNLVVLATSVATINNLQQITSSKTWQHLQASTIACASNRIAHKAKNKGFKNIINTQSANPSIIAEKLNKIIINPTKIV